MPSRQLLASIRHAASAARCANGEFLPVGVLLYSSGAVLHQLVENLDIYNSVQLDNLGSTIHNSVQLGDLGSSSAIATWRDEQYNQPLKRLTFTAHQAHWHARTLAEFRRTHGAGRVWWM